MNKTMLPRNLWQRLRLDPLPRRVRTDGIELTRMDDDWIPVGFDRRKGMRLMNVRTDHVVVLDFADIHQYDAEGVRDFDGLKHGRLKLRVQLTLSGCNLYKRRLPKLRSRRRTAH
jgi:hypothetical protein